MRLTRPSPLTGKSVFGKGAARADHGPAERWQHDGRVLELTEQAGVVAARALATHGLDVLLLRGFIDAAGCDSGLRWRADYYTAHLAERVTASYAVTRGGGGGYQEYERTDVEEAAYQRWRVALRAIGVADSMLMLNVCCYDLMPPPTALPGLRRGLIRLARHYGFGGRAPN